MATHWSSLGTPPNVTIGYNSTVAKNADGRLEAFVINTASDGSLWHIAQTAPNGTWNAWASLGAPSYAAGSNTEPSAPVIVANDDGRLEAFIIGADGALWHIWQLTPGGRWSKWESLGLPPEVTGLFPSPALRVNADGRLEAFAISLSSDGGLWHIWQLAAGGRWSSWNSLGKPRNDSSISSPTVGENADGRVEMFATDSGQDNALWHIWQLGSAGQWSNWGSLGTPPNVNGFSSSLFVRKNDDGRMEVFIVGQDKALWHIWQTAPNSAWNGWQSLSTPPSVNIFSAPSVRKNKDGHLEAFVIGSNGALWHIWQVVPEGAWGRWFSLDAPPNAIFNNPAAPSIAENDDGRLEAFAVGSDGALWHIWQLTPGGPWG